DARGAGHGTHVAGIVGAARNGIGVIGVAPGVRLASVKVVDADGYVYPEYALCGIMWAAEQDMEVTNNSYLVDPWAQWCSTDPDQAAVAAAMRRALAYSQRRDVVSVVAVGNAHGDLTAPSTDRASPNNGRPQQRRLDDHCRALPAGMPGVVELAAPGGDGWLDWGDEQPRLTDTIWSTLPGGQYGWLQGTSMAAPHVAGVAALVRSAHPDATAAEVRSGLRDGARPVPCPTDGYDYNEDGRPDATCVGDAGQGFYGAGLVDALAAVTD